MYEAERDDQFARAGPPTEGPAAPSPASPGPSQTSDGACYHLRRVLVRRLLKDGSLGLLLNGTSVVGFVHPEVQEYGWAINDQIVEVNGIRVSAFEEFLEQFSIAQEVGCPISFSVLRREATDSFRGDDDDITESLLQDAALESFLNASNLMDLTGRMERKFGAVQPPPEYTSSISTSLPDELIGDSHASTPITENPYIQALRKRRDELFRSVEDWSTEVAGSLASRLATERSDALATLVKPTLETPRTRAQNDLAGIPVPLAWVSCMATSASPCSSHHNEACAACEIQPTPRVDQESEAFRMPDEVQSWAGFESPQKETASRNFARRLLPDG